MRKHNSEFVTKFKSEAGTALFESDYFAFHELDNFACYVIADSIDVKNQEEAKAAEKAIKNIMASFMEAPSMRKYKIRDYLQSANSALKLNQNMVRWLASVTIIVTDYTSIRYATVGNTRFRMYRNEYEIEASEDQSLAQMYYDEDRITGDIVSEHEERHNLFTFLGQIDFYYKPKISKRIKLMDGDVLCTLTSGVWENVDDVDLREAINSSGDDPEKALDEVEDLILTNKEGKSEISPYTIALIFVNKIYIDPNRKKRIQAIIKYSIIALVVILVLSLVIFFVTRHRKRQREEMNIAYTQAIEYMNDNNFIKAAGELDTAEGLAKKLWDRTMRGKIAKYKTLVESINSADESFDSKKFDEAEASYLVAEKHSRFADNMGEPYISRKLNRVRDCINVQDYLHIGDTFFEAGNYTEAIAQYEKARKSAASANYPEGRELAIEALTKVAEQTTTDNELGHEKAKEEIAATDFIIAGDNAYKENDLDGAVMYYTMALEKYKELENPELVKTTEVKLGIVAKEQEKYDSKVEEAETCITEGDVFLSKYDYWSAKEQYIIAKEIYIRLQDEESVSDVQKKIDDINKILGFYTKYDDAAA